MTEIWRQERPTWCPHKDCAYRVSTQAVACLGELPNPTDHDGTPNTHRFCMRGASDDGEWLFKLELNQGDAAALVRIFSACFGLKASSLSASPAVGEEVVDRVADAIETAWHGCRQTETREIIWPRLARAALSALQPDAER